MPQDLILSIDNGTQSLRAILFDRHGEIQGKFQRHYPAYIQPEPGHCIQDANLYWQALCESCQGLWQQGIDPKQIKAVTVTSQRGSLVPVNSNGEPIQDAVLWTDQRKASVLQPMPFLWQSAFVMAGVAGTVSNFRRNALCNWVAQHHPERIDVIHKWLLLSGFLNYKLTGLFHDSNASQVGYLPFNFRKQQWAGKLSWQWHALAMQINQLPKLFKSSEVLGHISVAAAEQTGLLANTPVYASGADKACEVLGSGGTESSIACLSFGTTATVNVCDSQYREPIRHMPAYPAIIPDHFCYEVMLYRGFWMVSWFKEQFGQPESLRAEAADVEAESLFDELVDAVPPGAMGLVLQPYWGAGVREPGPEAKGAVIGFGDVHKREHLYRAILEGLNFGLKEGLEKICQRCHVKPEKLRISGGGSVSNAAMQIAADIFGMPAERLHTTETSSLGAAIAAATGLGWYNNTRQAASAMVRVSETFSPNIANQKIYQALYQDVYKTMYARLKPLYKKIQNITGYPE